MAFTPGHKFSSGRPKGSINRKTGHFREVLEARGFDLAEALVDIYNESIKFYEMNKTDPIGGPQALRLVLDSVREIGAYSQPKLKSIEVVKTNPLEGVTAEEKLSIMKEAVKMLEHETKSEEAIQTEDGD